MAVLEGGTSASLADVGAASAKGLHSIAKPQDYGSLGSYKFAGVTGAIAAGMAANGEIFQLRWSDATRFAIIHKIKITGLRATTAFAAGAIDLKATMARSWSANGSGGTALTLTDPQLQLRTSMGATLLGDARIATTAALGAGTKTLDTHDVGFIAAHSSAGDGAAAPIIGSIKVPNNGELFMADVASGEHPIVLAQNEGVVIRATVPATGVWNASVEIVWSEVTAF
jgi:hypothetical protein